MNYNEQLNILVNNLSEKFGVAADGLYSALMKQVAVDGFANIIWCIALVVVIAILVKKIKKWSNPIADDYYSTKAMGNELKLILGWVALVIFAFLAIDLLYWAFTAFYNPQYYMVHDLLSSIGD